MGDPTCVDCANGTCDCPCEKCVGHRESVSPADSCADCTVLRELLRVALGKLRDVQRADVTGVVDQLEFALDNQLPKGA